MRRTGLTTMYFTLSQRRLRWLGHVLRMGNERITKSMLYSELVDGTRKRSHHYILRMSESLNVGDDNREEPYELDKICKQTF